MTIFQDNVLGLRLLFALIIAFAISFGATPIVKTFAEKVGAMDVPGEARRMHDHPIPRMGGLAIFLGFILSVVLLVPLTRELRGILLGAVIIVTVGIIDDLVSLSAMKKLIAQLIAAVIPVLHGVVIRVVMNPNLFSGDQPLFLGVLGIPITILWIVGITNSVNLIDGLDGLAVGVSTVSSITILVVSLIVSEPTVALVLAALTGACIGFMPYNINPAKIFMGDTGALLLGYILATMSVLGMFKFYALVTFAVPVLALAVPLSDTIFAFLRRLLRGQNPMTPDRGHFHHRLIDMGLSQKQAVAILYAVSALLGLAAVVLATSGAVRILLLVFTFLLAGVVWVMIYRDLHQLKKNAAEAQHNASPETSPKTEAAEASPETAPITAAPPDDDPGQNKESEVPNG
ncbi:MAG: MraY family glycosyltransferase [Eubacteriales bacterium]|nr:MraY family glycosyltransferase [Eubacteriales bacterium]